MIFWLCWESSLFAFMLLFQSLYLILQSYSFIILVLIFPIDFPWPPKDLMSIEMKICCLAIIKAYLTGSLSPGPFELLLESRDDVCWALYSNFMVMLLRMILSLFFSFCLDSHIFGMLYHFRASFGVYGSFSSQLHSVVSNARLGSAITLFSCQNKLFLVSCSSHFLQGDVWIALILKTTTLKSGMILREPHTLFAASLELFSELFYSFSLH